VTEASVDNVVIEFDPMINEKAKLNKITLKVRLDQKI
jgi:hypothetical protein